MAYEINKRTEADYRWFRFEAPTDLLGTLDHNLKIADGVLRFRIFKVDPNTPTSCLPSPPLPARASAPVAPATRRPRPREDARARARRRRAGRRVDPSAARSPPLFPQNAPRRGGESRRPPA